MGSDTPRLDYEELRKLLDVRTEGDWHIEAVSDAVRVIVGEGRRKWILARGKTPQIPEEETTANLKLMALAPTLAREILERQRWIPVSAETMPKLHEVVIVGWSNDPVAIHLAFLGSDGKFIDREDGETFTEEPTHWQPLDTPPSAPSQEGQKIPVEAPDAPHSPKEGR